MCVSSLFLFFFFSDLLWKIFDSCEHQPIVRTSIQKCSNNPEKGIRFPVLVIGSSLNGREEPNQPGPTFHWQQVRDRFCLKFQIETDSNTNTLKYLSSTKRVSKYRLFPTWGVCLRWIKSAATFLKRKKENQHLKQNSLARENYGYYLSKGYTLQFRYALPE